eukprot:6140164-Lingulodinium_polyedra.AAC.1
MAMAFGHLAGFWELLVRRNKGHGKGKHRQLFRTHNLCTGVQRSAPITPVARVQTLAWFGGDHSV